MLQDDAESCKMGRGGKMGTDIERSCPSARGSGSAHFKGPIPAEHTGVLTSPGAIKRTGQLLESRFGVRVPETAVSRDSPSPFSESHARSCVFGCRPPCRRPRSARPHW